MPVYEFQCPQGHVVEDLVQIGTKAILCPACIANMKATERYVPELVAATRILSPTPTTFRFADQRK